MALIGPALTQVTTATSGHRDDCRTAPESSQNQADAVGDRPGGEGTAGGPGSEGSPVRVQQGGWRHVAHEGLLPEEPEDRVPAAARKRGHVPERRESHRQGPGPLPDKLVSSLQLGCELSSHRTCSKELSHTTELPANPHRGGSGRSECSTPGENKPKVNNLKENTTESRVPAPRHSHPSVWGGGRKANTWTQAPQCR